MRPHCLSQGLTQALVYRVGFGVLQAVATQESQPAFGVDFLPKGHKYGGPGLLASVLDSLQSHGCFYSKNFLGPYHGTWRPLLKYTFGYFLLFIAL